MSAFEELVSQSTAKGAGKLHGVVLLAIDSDGKSAFIDHGPSSS